MRELLDPATETGSPIWEAWLNADVIPLTGDRAPNGVVTVETDWYLNKTGRAVGTSKKGPFRWYQREDNSQTETVLPNVIGIDIDRSIDTDAANCSIRLKNFRLDTADPIELPGQLGQPGYYTWARGKSGESLARWNQETNEWEDVIVPNALLRTYQGYGGRDLDLEDAISQGYLALTGVWMVDDVAITTGGQINLRCRDVGKLLIDQVLYKPLVPGRSDCYPQEWCRWYYEQFDASFDDRPPPNPPGGPANISVPTWNWGSQDAWYGFNASIHGHRGTDSLDGNTETFALSVGNSHYSKDFCADYFEYTVNGKVDQVYVHPWGGNYTMYISVKENGVWQGDQIVPYDYTSLCPTQTCVDTHANERYVFMTGVPWETGAWYRLPREYNASHVRVTFRNHTQSPWGPWFYRCGIREMKVGYGVRETSTGVSTLPWTFGAAPYRNDEVNEAGYWCVDESGRVFAFGDAREQPQSGGGAHDHFAIAIRGTPSGEGYWVLLQNGRVKSYGDASHYGDDVNSGHDDYIDMAPTGSGNGYYLLRRNGRVANYGDATFYGHKSSSTSNPQAYSGTGIETHPTIPGYWIMDGNGAVSRFGSVPNFGGISGRAGLETNEWCRGIRRTENGDGYWILGGAGSVANFGVATDFGEFDASLKTGTPDSAEGFRKLTWDLIPSAGDDGYLILQADGTIQVFGDADFFGNPGGTGIKRIPGNYEDYTDIVRMQLLWSGFHLYTDSHPAGDEPWVYGNLENTGAYADECLPEDMFDKKAPIEPINALKEIVGYIFWIDDEGAAHFESPNWWGAGNFYEDGTWVAYIPEIDETRVLTDYGVNYTGSQARSEIIISTEYPEDAGDTTVTTKYVPATAAIMRGMINPAMWVNGVFKNRDEQRIMAELIAMHIWFSMRTGNVTMLANPGISINDQVRIFERQTAETYIHYVRGVRSTMDLEQGQYTMQLETHWLGDAEGAWVITSDNIPDAEDGRTQIQISSQLRDWLENMESKAVDVARVTGFSGVLGPTSYQVGSDIPDGSPGAADG